MILFFHYGVTAIEAWKKNHNWMLWKSTYNNNLQYYNNLWQIVSQFVHLSFYFRHLRLLKVSKKYVEWTNKVWFLSTGETEAL